MKKLRIVFFGTPDFAVASLKALIDNQFNVVAAVTAPDKPAGRGHKLQASPVKEYAQGQGLTVLQPTNLKAPEFVEQLRALRADLQIVVAFRMLPEVVWDMPAEGTYNVHGSLLPDYRGAAPINWAIANGEKESGVTTFKLKHEIDTGSILLQARTAIGPEETAGSLYERLMHIGAETLVKSVTMIAEGRADLKPQPTPREGTHAPKIFKADCKINWAQPAQEVHNFVRGMAPFPGAFAEMEIDGTQENWKLGTTELTGQSCNGPGSIKLDGNRLLFATADEWIAVKTIQAPGKKRLNADDFFRGARFAPKDVKVNS